MSRKMILLFAIAACSATPAMAYVGPGSSLGAIGVALGLIGTIFLTLLSFIWYPVKRATRQVRRRLARAGMARTTTTGRGRPRQADRS